MRRDKHFEIARGRYTAAQPQAENYRGGSWGVVRGDTAGADRPEGIVQPVSV